MSSHDSNQLSPAVNHVRPASRSNFSPYSNPPPPSPAPIFTVTQPHSPGTNSNVSTPYSNPSSTSLGSAATLVQSHSPVSKSSLSLDTPKPTGSSLQSHNSDTCISSLYSKPPSLSLESTATLVQRHSPPSEKRTFSPDLLPPSLVSTGPLFQTHSPPLSVTDSHPEPRSSVSFGDSKSAASHIRFYSPPCSILRPASESAIDLSSPYPNSQLPLIQVYPAEDSAVKSIGPHIHYADVGSHLSGLLNENVENLCRQLGWHHLLCAAPRLFKYHEIVPDYTGQATQSFAFADKRYPGSFMIVRTEPSAVTISILTAKTTGANRECEYCECPMAHSEMKSTMLEPSLFDSEEKAALRKALKDQSKQFLRTVGRLCEREVRGYQRQEKIRRLEGCYEKTKNSLQSSMKVLSSSMSPSQRRSREYDGSAAEYFKCPDKQTNLPAIPSGSPRVSAGSSAHLISEAYTSLFAKNSDNAGSWRNRLKGLHLFKKPRRSNDTDLVEPSVEISGKPNSLSEEDLGSPPSEVLTSALNFYADWNLGNAESSRAWMRAVSGEAVEIAEAEAFISEMAAMINHSRFHGRDSDAVSIASSGSSFYDPSFASSQSTLCGGQEDLRSESPDSGCTFDKGDFVPEPMLGLVSTLCEKSDMAS